MSLMMPIELRLLRWGPGLCTRDYAASLDGGAMKFRITPLRAPLTTDEDMLAMMLFAGYSLTEHNEDLLLASGAVNR